MSRTRFVVMLLTLYAFWWFMSGMATPFLLAAGFGSSLAVTLLAARMGLLQREDAGLRHVFALLGYLGWLLLEIVKSSWQVTKLILHPSLPITPTLARVRPSQRTVAGLVIHANSITLTPGTYTIDASADAFLVHGLTVDGADGDVDSETDRRVRALELA